MDTGTHMDGGTCCWDMASGATIHVVFVRCESRGQALHQTIGVIIAFLTLAPPAHRHCGRARSP